MDFSVEWHERLGSTNAHMKASILRGETVRNRAVVAAREQTAGRGRQDRKWLSAPNTNLCFSVFVETGAELIEVPSLTMAAALAAVEMLQGQGVRAAPKWPNDVLVGDRKICGILSERVEQNGTGAKGIIVGVGLNVNMTAEEAGQIDRPATSVLLETGRAHDPARILDAFLPLLDFWIEEWVKGGFTALREVWLQRAGPLGKPLSVHDGDLIKSGTLAGFGEHGELLLQTGEGLETIWSGEVS